MNLPKNYFAMQFQKEKMAKLKERGNQIQQKCKLKQKLNIQEPSEEKIPANKRKPEKPYPKWRNVKKSLLWNDYFSALLPYIKPFPGFERLSSDDEWYSDEDEEERKKRKQESRKRIESERLKRKQAKDKFFKEHPHLYEKYNPPERHPSVMPFWAPGELDQDFESSSGNSDQEGIPRDYLRTKKREKQVEKPKETCEEFEIPTGEKRIIEQEKMMIKEMETLNIQGEQKVEKWTSNRPTLKMFDIKQNFIFSMEDQVYEAKKVEECEKSNDNINCDYYDEEIQI